MNTLQYALAAARRGWPVFPVVPGTKRPAIRDWETRATTDPARIERAWNIRRWNVGIACGPAGLLVVDLDVAKDADDTAPEPFNQLGINHGADVLAVLAEQAGATWPQTFTVATPSGGTHLYFTAPRRGTYRNSQSAIGWKIDTRADGGYVLSPGSALPAGTYRTLVDTDPVMLPHWLTTRLDDTRREPPPPPPSSIPTGGRGAYLHAAIRGEQRRIETARRGNHNRSIFIAACALGQLVAGGALTEAEARAALWHAAQTHVTSRCGCTTREVEKTIASGLRTGAGRPRGTAA